MVAQRGHYRMPLLAVVEDPTYWPRVRTPALDAWIAGPRGRTGSSPSPPYRTGHDLQRPYQGSRPTARGTLLAARSTPGISSPPKCGDYFDPPSRLVINRFTGFGGDLVKTVPTSICRAISTASPTLIEPFSAIRIVLSYPICPCSFWRGLWSLTEHGSKPRRLFRWLQVGMEARGKLTPLGVKPREATRTVTTWLQAHPTFQKALIRFALRTEEFRALESADYHLSELLYRSTLLTTLASGISMRRLPQMIST